MTLAGVRRLIVGIVVALSTVSAPLAGAGRQPSPTHAPPAAPITVFAASDLGPAFKRMIPEYTRQTGTAVTLVLGSTGTLTHQIRNGAPADVFFAANEDYVQQLAAESLTIEGTRSLYARGRIAIVSLKSAAPAVLALSDLASDRVRRIALANPAHAPYGLAARQALEATGLWNAAQTKVVYGENVQQAVQFVRSGSAEAGIVARSVADSPDLRWELIDERLHAPLNQAAVVIARTRQAAAARAFIDFVNGAHGRSIMREFGFLPPRD
jgi:molybdate transport system substrate-binding protein